MKTFSKTPGNEKTRLISCVMCNGSDFRAWRRSKRFVRCRHCGLVFQNPQPVPSDLAVRYDQEYFEYERQNEAAFFRLMRLGLDDIAFEKTVEKRIVGEKTFLDVGCATGRLLEYLRGRGWTVCGVEVCEPSAQYGRRIRGLDIFPGTLEQADFPAGSMDVIHCSHLIEHLTDPAGFLDRVNALLKPDGVLIITTPNRDGLQGVLFGDGWRSAIDDHMYLFSRRNLVAFLRRHGFHPFSQKTWGGIAAGMAPALIKKPLDRLAKRFGFGDVMIIAARKSLVPDGMFRCRHLDTV